MRVDRADFVGRARFCVEAFLAFLSSPRDVLDYKAFHGPYPRHCEEVYFHISSLIPYQENMSSGKKFVKIIAREGEESKQQQHRRPSHNNSDLQLRLYHLRELNREGQVFVLGLPRKNYPLQTVRGLNPNAKTISTGLPVWLWSGDEHFPLGRGRHSKTRLGQSYLCGYGAVTNTFRWAGDATQEHGWGRVTCVVMERRRTLSAGQGTPLKNTARAGDIDVRCLQSYLCGYGAVTNTFRWAGDATQKHGWDRVLSRLLLAQQARTARHYCVRQTTARPYRPARTRPAKFNAEVT
uniref:Uncharacterized protein n=1 Tax=Branchiostoma floridae TaxID=7739 RepID=C3ZE73_BRAFL|eukprot:XP_002593018.1 hypothetical protein BRAFLDRAFT_74337 [Branchiostoma floridae]